MAQSAVKSAGTTHTQKLRARVTIADVSRALGMNKSTVSRALNDYSDISESTRQRVRKTADRMGYQPLGSAQAIRTGRSRSLGLVIQLADHDSYRPFLAEFIAGLSQGASAAGWTLTVATADSPQATTDTFQKMIKDGKADGFVLARTMIDDARVTLLRAAQVPFVLFGRSADPDGCAWHDVRGEDAMRDAVHHLARLGHRHIGFINGGMQFTYGALRQAGFFKGMKEAGLTADPRHIATGALTRAEGCAAALDILTTPAPPTAIICAVDMAALGVYRAADDCGLTIGRDLSLIGYDGIPDGAHVTPQLSTFDVDHTASGARLSALLIRRIKGEDLANLRELVPATFQDRGSTGPPRCTPADIAARVAAHTTD